MNLDPASVLRAAESSLIRRKGPSGRVWELTGSSKRTEVVRNQLLQCVLANCTRVLVCYDEEEAPDAALQPHLANMGRGRFAITGGAPVKSLRDWLYLGNWQMMGPHDPQDLVDIVRASEGQAVRFVDENNLDILIDSFHDDSPWVVVLGRQSALSD
ncbi:MAG: hypothetical protein R3E77_16600 [Steroidobacteraceae bacterium]